MKRARLSNEPTDLNRSNSEKRFKSNPSSRKSIPTSSTSLPLYEKPYQHETGVDLNFNFWTWQNNQYLNASTHLYELFSVLIESKNVSFLKPIEPSFKFNSMVVVNLTHLDPISFNEYVTKLRLKGSKPKTAAKASKSFFAQSSSMPIHCEMKIDDRSRHISDYVPAFESIVWRDKAVIDLSAFLLYKGVRSKLIFADHVLVFKVSIFQVIIITSNHQNCNC